MARPVMHWDNGTADFPDRVRGPLGAAPVSDTIETMPGESLADKTMKAYGHNSQSLREKLLRANADITNGQIIAPR